MLGLSALYTHTQLHLITLWWLCPPIFWHEGQCMLRVCHTLYSSTNFGDNRSHDFPFTVLTDTKSQIQQHNQPMPLLPPVWITTPPPATTYLHSPVTCGTRKMGIDDLVRVGIQLDKHLEDELASCKRVLLRTCIHRHRTRACLDQHLIAIRSQEVLGNHVQSKTWVIVFTLCWSAAVQTRPTTDTMAGMLCCSAITLHGDDAWCAWPPFPVVTH